MIHKLHTGILLAASVGLGLTGVVACGNATGSLGTSSYGVNGYADAGDAGADANATGSQGSNGFSISDCSPAQVATILRALNTAEINEANLALSTSSNSDVKTFATQMVQDHTNLDRQLTQWFDSSGMSAMDSDISTQLTAQAGDESKALMSSSSFDRDYAADAVIDHVKALGFVNVFAVPSDQALANLLVQARTTIQNHLQMAFALEQKVVGSCGSAGADAGACNDGGMGDSGNATGSQGAADAGVDSGNATGSQGGADAGTDAGNSTGSQGGAADAGANTTASQGNGCDGGMMFGDASACGM